jgi:hypothetical protein
MGLLKAARVCRFVSRTVRLQGVGLGSCTYPHNIRSSHRLKMQKVVMFFSVMER